ncbi:MAG: hypothetical protein CMH49_01705 [Myxococcales bacterium]|nr:hypothetical protein [Myxococcales bacterium]
MTKLTQAETASVRSQRGYWGVITAVLCASVISSLGLFQSLKLHQRQARESLIAQVLEEKSTPEYDQNYLGTLQVRQIALQEESSELPVAQQTEGSIGHKSTQVLAALSTLVDDKSGRQLDQASDKAWFDAYWKPKTLWYDAQGQLWGRHQTLMQRPSTEKVQRSFRLIAKLSSVPSPQLSWFWFFLCTALSLICAGGACFYFDHSRQSKPWYLPLSSTLSALPLVVISFLEVVKREQQTGLDISEGPLVASLALLPMLFLAISQFKTRGASSAHRIAYTYMMPTLLSVGLLVFVPFSLGVALSFMRHHQGEFTWVGLSHFIDILAASDYPLSHPLNFYFTLAVTLFWTASNVILHTSIGLSLALILNRKGLKLKGVYRALLIIPWAIPNYITALIWKGMFNQQYGLINKVLALLGVEPVSWMGSFWGAMAANISTNTWLGFPFMMVVTLGALQSIPQDLYEAARLAGASKWQTFKAITLPLLKPALLPAVILGSVWTFNMFNIIYLVSGGQPGGATDILITEAYRWAFEQDRYGYAAAYSLIIFLILLGYARLTQKMTQAAEEVYQ